MARVRETSGLRPQRLPVGAAGRVVAVPLVAAAMLLLMSSCSEDNQRKYSLGDPCDPARSSQCADNLCLPLDDVSGVCARRCTTDDDCGKDESTSFKCEDSGRHGLVCLRSSQCVDEKDCPSGHWCDTASGSCYIKVSRTLCSPCTIDLQCPEGGACFTVPASGERYCTTACGAEDACPAGYVCSEVPFLRDGVLENRKQCVPENAAGTCEAGHGICTACKGDDECGGFADLCVRNVVSGEQFCAAVCDPARGAAGCPKGFSCLDLSGNESGPYQCVPNSGTCGAYCDSADERVQVRQCGLGRQCNVTEKQCEGASDGRECSPCETNDECRKPGHETNECVVNNCESCPAKGESFCAEPCPCAQAGCTDGTAQCQSHFGAGFICSKVGTAAFCVPQRGTCESGLGRLGDSCPKGAEDCVTGVCLAYGKNALCSSTCAADAECGDEHFRCCERAGDFYDCSDARRNAAKSGPASGAGVCAPVGGLFGDDCRPGRPPCQSGTCLDIGTARLCTVRCAADDSCPPDFVCRLASAELAEVLHCQEDSHCPPEHICDQALKECRIKVCFPDGGGEPGGDCTFGPAACSDRLCIKKESGPVCTTACEDSNGCPVEWVCESITPLGKTEKIQACMPPGVTSP
ncbi:MAG: hypothetical protein HY901_28580 [Deltaproteobacteria bacterium]|nr:hypothetical protein [Deltaproteobacteria bacterium]